jgi:hypothetical protein
MIGEKPFVLSLSKDASFVFRLRCLVLEPSPNRYTKHDTGFVTVTLTQEL